MDGGWVDGDMMPPIVPHATADGQAGIPFERARRWVPTHAERVVWWWLGIMLSNLTPPPPPSPHKPQPPKDGEQVAGNPNTLYMFAAFNDSAHDLTPADYPMPPWDPPNQPPSPGPKPPSGPAADMLMGVTFQRNEAIVLMFCTPPPAKYFGLTSYVTNRLLPNMTEYGTGFTDTTVHRPMAEVHTQTTCIPPRPAHKHSISPPTHTTHCRSKTRSTPWSPTTPRVPPTRTATPTTGTFSSP